MTEKFLKLTDATTLSLLALLTAASLLFPPFASPDLAFLYRTAIAVAGFLFIMSNKFLKEELKLETPVDGNLLALFTWYLVSALFAKNIFSAFNAAVAFAVFLLFFYVVYSYSKKYFLQFIIFTVGMVFILCLYGLYQYLAGFDEALKYIAQHKPEQFDAIKQRLESRRIFSTLIYPNTFAGLLVLVIPAVVSLFKEEKKYRPLTFAVLLILVTNLLLTKSVGAFVSLIAGAFIVLFFISDPGLNNFRRLFMIFILVSTALLVVVLKMRGFSMVIPGIQAKLETYLRMVDVAQKYFLTGAGPGGFEAVYNDPVFGKAQHLKYAHNFIFQSAIELGVIGISLFLIAGYRAYRAVIQNFYFLRTPYKKNLVFSLLVGITAFLIHNLVDFDICNFEVALVFLIMLAVLLSQLTLGLIQLKKIKLTYLLGLNPGRRRYFIFLIVLAVLGLSAVTAGKYVYILTAINVLITAGFAIWSISKEDIRRTDLDIPIVLLLLWSGFSLFITPDLNSGIKIYTMLTGGGVIFYLCSQFLRPYAYRITIAHFIAYTGIVLCVFGAGQYLYRFFTGRALYIDCFFPNQDLFAAYMCLPFAFLLGKVLFEKNIRSLWPKVLMLVLFAVITSLAVSKSGMLTMVFVFCGTWVYYRYYREKVNDNPSMARFKSWLLPCLMALLLALAFTPLSPSGRKMLSVKEDPFYFNRLGIYKAALKMGVDRVFTGYGLGSFEKAFPRYNFPINSVARYQKETPFAHNEPLQVFATLGLPGLIIAALLIISLMRNLPSYEGHRKLWAAKSGAYFGIAGILFHSLFYFTLHVPGIFYTVAAVASIIAAERYSIKTVPREALLFTKIYYFPALLLAFVVFSFAIRPAAAHFLYGKYLAEKKYKYVVDASLVEPANPAYAFERGLYFEKNGNLRAAAPFFERALKFDSMNYLYSLHAARAYAGIDDYEEAVKNYSRAVSSNPYRAFSYAELGNFYYIKQGDPELAFENLLKAVAVEPNYMEARNNLAALYIRQKKYKEALEEYDKMEETLARFTPLNDYEKNIMGLPGYMVFASKAVLLRQMGRKNNSCAYYLKALASGAPAGLLKELEVYCGKDK